jgi:uncharacterized protein YjbI with pentapeptide repeats
MERKQWFGRWPWVVVGALGVLAALVGLGWAVWKLPPLLYGDVTKASPDARLQAAGSFRTALVAGLAGLAALAGLFFTNRTYRLTQQGQITERYTKAIEQLGDDKLDVRLGGIYALESIAYDSAKNRGYREHRTIVEVLSAFVREHGKPAAQPSPGTADDANGKPTKPIPRPTPPADVQAAATVLGRLPRRRDVSRGDLHGAHLEGAILAGAHLEHANLISAHLEQADLGGAHLEHAILAGVQLEQADLRGAHLGHANLIDAHLEKANLGGADLEQADLDSACLKEATLVKARLERAGLSNAHLEGAFLVGAHLERAYLDHAHLKGAYMDGAYLEQAIVNPAQLEEAIWRSPAQLEGAVQAAAKGATLLQMAQAVLDEGTHAPPEAQPPTGATPPPSPADEQP